MGYQCVVQLIFRLIVLNILSACKAEEGNVAVATLTDDNAADGKIGSAISLIMGWTAHWSGSGGILLEDGSQTDWNCYFSAKWA